VDKAERMRRARQGLNQTGYTEEYRVEIPSVVDRKARTARVRETAFLAPGLDGTPRVTHVARDISWQFDTTAQLRAEISRRADAERGLSDATHRLEALVATTNDAVISIDEASLVIDWNPAAERMFGWKRQEVLGRLLTELIMPPVHRPRHMAGIEKFLRDGTAPFFNRRVETRALRRSGEEFHAELSVWPVRTGEHYTFSSFVRDISRRKAAEKALADSEAKYRKVVENVNQTLGMPEAEFMAIGPVGRDNPSCP
jgi:PAS domain S-box-containing protein